MPEKKMIAEIFINEDGNIIIETSAVNELRSNGLQLIIAGFAVSNRDSVGVATRTVLSKHEAMNTVEVRLDGDLAPYFGLPVNVPNAQFSITPAGKVLAVTIGSKFRISAKSPENKPDVEETGAVPIEDESEMKLG
jgi:hypothetical protein